MLFLLRARARIDSDTSPGSILPKWMPSLPWNGGLKRAMSPPFGASILMTSAPSPARTSVPYGPASATVRSSTRRPSSGRGAGALSDMSSPFLAGMDHSYALAGPADSCLWPVRST